MRFNKDSEVLKKMMIPALIDEEGDNHIKYYKGIKIRFSRNIEKCWEAKIFIENITRYGISIMELNEFLCKETLTIDTKKIQDCYFAIYDQYIIVKSYVFPPSKLNDYIKYIDSKDEIKGKYNEFLFNYRYEKDYITLNDIINSCKTLIDRILDNDKIKNS